MEQMRAVVEQKRWMHEALVGALAAVLAGGCTPGPGGSEDEVQAGAAAAVTGDLTSAPDGWLPGDPCDPKTDGWLPEPLPEGKPGQVMINVPDGYQASPPAGEPYCAPMDAAYERGTWQLECRSDAKCPKGAVCAIGYEYCVSPCTSDDDCEGGTCLSGRLEYEDGTNLSFCACRKQNCEDVVRRNSPAGM